MAYYLIEDSTITAIANAIRSKDGTTAAIKGADIAARIAAIVSGGAEFYGCPIETGTVVVSAGIFTGNIYHSLGTIKGAILFFSAKINNVSIKQVMVENIGELACVVQKNNSGEYTNSTESFMNRNFNNMAGFYSSFSIDEATTVDYILLGA